MDARDHDDWPAALARGRSRFAAWRRQRSVGARIPRALWALAVRLAERHGVSATANALGLDYYSLKKQVAAAAGQGPANGPAFVELPAPMVLGKQCHFELDNGHGVRMRGQLVGCETADVAALVRSFWKAE